MHIAIVEDYPAVASQIERITREFLGRRVSSIQRFEDIDSFFDHLDEHPVDLVLLDLNLGGDDGFEILKQVSSGSFFTIIISANTHRALEAFEYGVLDFVGKPVDSERLAKALARLDETPPGDRTPLRYLAVSRHGAIRLVAIEDVLFVQGAGKYSELHLTDGNSYLHDKSLDRLEILLRGRFRRIHKSYLVDWSQVQGLNILGGGSYEAELKNGRLLPVGRTRYRELRDELG